MSASPVQSSTAPAPSRESVLEAFKALAAADPAAAFHLRDDLLDVIREADYPELVVGTVPDEWEDGRDRPALLDPRTGEEVLAITAVDVSERWTETEDIDLDGKVVRITHPSAADYEDLVYLDDNNQPVRLPEDWEAVFV